MTENPPLDYAKRINRLLSTTNDGCKAYQTAAEHVTNPELQQLFTEYSTQRASFARELEALIPAFGKVEPNTEGTAGGAFHRGWMAFREGINWENEVVVLAELGKEEDYAIGQYDAVLKDGLPADAASVAARQKADVQAALARLKMIYADPNKSDRGPIPGVKTDATGTTPAGRAPVPDKQGVTRQS